MMASLLCTELTSRVLGVAQEKYEKLAMYKDTDAMKQLDSSSERMGNVAVELLLRTRFPIVLGVRGKKLFCL